MAATEKAQKSAELGRNKKVPTKTDVRKSKEIVEAQKASQLGRMKKNSPDSDGKTEIEWFKKLLNLVGTKKFLPTRMAKRREIVLRKKFLRILGWSFCW